MNNRIIHKWPILLMALLVSMSPYLAQAQGLVQIPVESYTINAEQREALQENFSDYQTLKLDTDILETSVRSGNLVSISIPEEEWFLDLNAFEIRTDDYISTLDGKVIEERSICPTFRGKDFNHPDRKVFASISSEYITFCSKSDDQQYLLEPLRLILKDRNIPKGIFIYYKSSDVIPEKGSCGADAVTDDDHDHGSYKSYQSEEKSGTQECLLVSKIETNTDAVALAFDFFNNTSLANDYTLNIINLVSDIYESSPRIQFVVSAQNNYSFLSGAPWSTSETVDSATLLDDFRDWMEDNRPYDNFNRTVSVFFTGKNLTNPTAGPGAIGRAYFPSQNPLCSTYNVNEILSTTSLMKNLVAHEIGHNFNARHCDGSGCGPSPCNTQNGTLMCGQLGSNTSSQFTQDSRNAIRSHAETRMETAGCFGKFTRVVTVAQDPSSYFGNTSGVTTLDFIYHIVETSGTMVIGNSHSGLTWNTGERLILKPGFRAAPNSTARDVNLGISPCEVFPTPAAIGQSTSGTSEYIADYFSDVSAFDAKVFPNPTTGSSQVELKSSEENTVNIMVYDVLGRIVMETRVLLVAGLNRFDLPTESFTQGLYLVTIQDDLGSTETLKLQKID